MNDHANRNRSAKNGAGAASSSEAGQSVADLWAVSYSDDDDRELTSTQIAGAIRRGEIDGETIVWRPGMDDWEPLSERPELSPLLEPPKPAPPPPPAAASDELPDELPASLKPSARRYAPVVGFLALLLIAGGVWLAARDPASAESVASATSAVPAAAPAPAPTPLAAAQPSAKTAASAAVEPPVATAEFDRLRALRHLAALAEKASRCRARGAPEGTVRVAVTFEPTGTPSAVRVFQAPYAGTPTAQCIVKKLGTAKVDPFRGSPVTVRIPVELR